MKDFRTGFGYDVHQLAKDRKLILGGVEIPFHLGLSGHSDADVLLHAVCDALLGTLSLGDIGTHFPNTDEAYKNISSLNLLKEVKVLLEEKNYKINNIDCMLVMEEPKISSFIPQMKNQIDGVIKIGSDRISIKATTNEKIGFIGRGEGIAAFATVSVVSSDD